LAAVKRFKPVFDAYTGPYKDNCELWTGLLLPVCNILIVTFAVNVFGKNSLNLLTIAGASLLIQVLAWILNGVYKKRYLNILESVFILNLGILSTAVCYAKFISQSTNYKPATNTSVDITFLVLIGILLFHAHKQVARSQKMEEIFSLVTKKENLSDSD